MTVALTAYRYCGQWNDLTLRPIGSESMLTEDQARGLYRNHDDGFAVLPDLPGIGEGSLVAPWDVQAQTRSRTFETRFYNPAGSVIRLIGWDFIDGRSFKADVIDYDYPETDERLLEFQALRITSTRTKPDGTSRVDINDKTTGERTRLSYHSVPVETYWLDYPAFGDWAPLHDPIYGDHDLTDVQVPV